MLRHNEDCIEAVIRSCRCPLMHNSSYFFPAKAFFSFNALATASFILVEVSLNNEIYASPRSACGLPETNTSAGSCVPRTWAVNTVLPVKMTVALGLVLYKIDMLAVGKGQFCIMWMRKQEG